MYFAPACKKQVNFFLKELLLSLLSCSCEVIQTECWNKPIKEAIHLHKWKWLSHKIEDAVFQVDRDTEF